MIQVVIGENFSFSIDHEVPSLLLMFSGSIGILAWKSDSVLLRVSSEGLAMGYQLAFFSQGDQVFIRR